LQAHLIYYTRMYGFLIWTTTWNKKS